MPTFIHYVIDAIWRKVVHLKLGHYFPDHICPLYPQAALRPPKKIIIMELLDKTQL